MMKIFKTKNNQARRNFSSKDFRDKVKNSRYQKRQPQPVTRKKSALAVPLFFKKKIYKAAVVGIAGVLVYFGAVSDYFVVSKFEVSGGSRLDKQEVVAFLEDYSRQRYMLVPKGNVLLLSRGALEDALRKRFPLIKTIAEFKRIFPDKAVLDVEERVPGLVIVSNGQRYLLDEEGVVVTTDIPKDVAVPVVIDQIDENYDLYEPLPNPKTAAFIISMNKSWETKIASSIVGIKIPGKSSTEAHFESAQGWTVFFDTSRSAATQLKNLASILVREVPAERYTNLSYIDLRSSNWAYYCYKDSPCVAGASMEEVIEKTDEKQ